MLTNLLPMVRRVDHQRVIHEAVRFQRIQYIAYQLVRPVHQSPVRRARANRICIGHILNPSPFPPPTYVRMARIHILSRYRWQADLAVIPIVIIWSRHERLVRQHQTNRQTQRTVIDPRTPPYPLVVDEIDSRLHDILIVDLVRRLPTA